jgi:hypothetical protein
VAARKTNGQFEKGHSGNPKGRPKRSTEEKYLTALSRRVTLKQWTTICDTAIARAKAGDGQARQWLSDYLMGKPIQRTEVSGPDGGPIEHRNFDRALERAYGDAAAADEVPEHS